MTDSKQPKKCSMANCDKLSIGTITLEPHDKSVEPVTWETCQEHKDFWFSFAKTYPLKTTKLH